MITGQEQILRNYETFLKKIPPVFIKASSESFESIIVPEARRNLSKGNIRTKRSSDPARGEGRWPIRKVQTNYSGGITASFASRTLSSSTLEVETEHGTLDNEYADFIEFGRGATRGGGGGNAWEEIRQWATSKLGADDQEAYAIYRSIMRAGYGRYPFFQPAWDGKYNQFFTKFRKEMKAGLSL